MPFKPLSTFGLFLLVIAPLVPAAGGSEASCIALTPSVPTPPQQEAVATLTIHTVEEYQDLPPVKGATVRIDGRVVGFTGADGRSTVQVQAGLHSVAAFVPLELGRRENIELADGEHATLRLVMKSEALSGIEDYELSIEGVVHGQLARDFQSFALQFQRPNGEAIPLTSIASIDILGYGLRCGVNRDEGESPPGEYIWIDQFFALSPDGLSMEAINLNGLKAVLAPFCEQVTFRAIAESSITGLSYEAYCAVELIPSLSK